MTRLALLGHPPRQPQIPRADVQHYVIRPIAATTTASSPRRRAPNVLPSDPSPRSPLFHNASPVGIQQRSQVVDLPLDIAAQIGVTHADATPLACKICVLLCISVPLSMRVCAGFEGLGCRTTGRRS